MYFLLPVLLTLQACGLLSQPELSTDLPTSLPETKTSVALATSGASHKSTARARQTQHAEEHPTQIMFAQKTQFVRDTATAVALQTPSPWPTSTIVSPSSEADYYKIVSLDYSDSLNLLTEAVIQYQQSSGYSDSFRETLRLERDDAIAFASALDSELARNYPDKLLNPESILTLQHPNWELGRQSWYPQYLLESIRCYHGFDAFDNLFIDAFVAYLNQAEIEFHHRWDFAGPAFEATVFQIEIDGDSSPEWFVKVDSSMFGGTFWVPLDHLENGIYRRLNSDMHLDCSLLYSGDDFKEVFLDLTGDGLTDLISGVNTYIGGGGNAQDISVLQGTSSGFDLLHAFRDGYHVSSDGGESLSYYIVIPGESSAPVLQVKEIQYLPWACSIEILNSYQWPNGIEQVAVERIEPEGSECLLAQAVDSFPVDNIDQKIHEIEFALELDKDNPSLTLDQLIFAHYRLALYHSMSENDQAARHHLEAIKDLAEPTSSTFADAMSIEIDKLLSEPKILPFSLCQVDNSLNLPSYSGIHIDVYMYEGLEGEYPRPLCRTYLLSESLISDITFPSQTSPEASLLHIGMPIVLAKPIDLSSTNEVAWIIVADYEDWRIVLLYDDFEGWQYDEYSGHYTTKPDEIQWINDDLTGDGQSEFALMFPTYPHPNSDMRQCENGKQAYKVFLSTGAGNGWTIHNWNHVCHTSDETLNLSDFLADDDNDGMIDWLANLLASDEFNIDITDIIQETPPSPWVSVSSLSWNLRNGDEDVYSILNDILERLEQGGHPSNIRNELNEVLSDISTDNIASGNARSYVNYLIALSYELEGRDEDAVRAYYDLWIAEPVTLWSFLAANRLSPK